MSTHLWAVPLPRWWQPVPLTSPREEGPVVVSKHHWCPAQKLPTHRRLCGLDRLPPRARVIQTFSPHSPIRFESELKAMTGRALNWYWKVMWGGVSPLLIISLFIFYLSDYIITGTLRYQAWDAAQVSAVSGVSLSETKCLSRIGAVVCRNGQPSSSSLLSSAFIGVWLLDDVAFAPAA